MNILESLNRGLETKYHLNEAKEDKERFLSFINATIKNEVKSQAIVDNFDKLKSSGRIKGQEADYYYWIKNKTVNELQDFLDAFNSTLSKTQTKKQEKEGAELIPCSNPYWVIYKIITYDASKYYGENTHWCITGRNGPDGMGAFNSYKNRGVKDYYFFWKIGNEKNGKWCYLDYGKPLQPTRDCFYDAQDNKHTIEEVDIPDDVLLSLPGISQKLIDDIQEKKNKELKQKKIAAEVQRTGVYTYNPLDDDSFIQKLKPKKVIIPDSVTKIGSKTFSYCESLQEVTFSYGLEEIGDSAFYGCSSLQEVNFPDSIEKIGSFAFKGCKSLQEINFPNSVKEIGYSAFSDCHSLQEVNFPDSIEKIDGFDNCTSLQEITIPNKVKEIGTDAFRNCTSLQEVNFPDSIEKIWECAFSGCTSLQEIHLPNSVEKIGQSAFDDCTSLQEIIIPNSVEKIGRYVFWGCKSLKEINIPDSVKEIETWVFSGCTSLQEIIIKGEYRPQIFKDTGLKDTVILNWVDCGIKETWGSI